MKRNNSAIRDLIYVHLNEPDQYVISYGIEFAEFSRALAGLLNNVLLLKHQYDDGEFNRHTLLDYVPHDKVNKLVDDEVFEYEEFCWVDFEEVEGLNELPGQELAELLYLGHIKEHLKVPFYNHLRNRFVYLAYEDGWWNKTYYRNLIDFYRVVGYTVAEKMGKLKFEKNILGLKVKRDFPPLSKEIILTLKGMMKEGALISIKDAEQNRLRIEIPIWVIGDFASMDDMYDEYQMVVKEKCDAKLVFDKKTREWKVYSH